MRLARITGSILVVAFVIVSISRGQDSRPQTQKLFEPSVIREDFQGDSLGQWASYPPAQDIGYEPSISPTSDYGAPGGRSLTRIVKPNRGGMQRFGFIKKVRLTAASDSRLRFSYRLNSHVPATIEIGLAGINAHLYNTKLIAKPNEWTVADLSLNELRVPKGVGIEAVFIIANIPSADPDFTYHFIIDDIALSGVNESRFDVLVPATEMIEPWPEFISASTYRAGDTIQLEARAPARMSAAECLLQTTSGHVIHTGRLFDDGSHGDKRAGDGIWTNSRLYDVGASDSTGVLLVKVRGTTVDRQSVETTVRIINRGQNSSSHPGLFFAPNDREKLIARSRDPKLSALWTYLQTTAKTTRESGTLAHGGAVFELLDSEYLLPSLLGYFDVMNRARSRIAYNAFNAYLTGDIESRNAAKSALIDVSQWKRWEPPWFKAHGQHTYYPAGLLAADVALGYDLLYEDLSEPERHLIRRALIEKSIIPTFREYVADNRLMTNTSNWIAHTVGGAVIAAASIANDVTEKDGKFEIYVGGLLRKLEDHIAASFLADGSYGEGISYHEFDAETLGPALVATERAFGADYWKDTNVLESLTYPLYTLTQPLSASPDMGDTHPPAGHGIAPIVYRSKDPVVRWYYSQFNRPSLAKFIFYDDSIQPRAPELPTSKVFPERGNAIFRSGWDGDDIVFLFRAGPNFNHHHADQGSFLLTAFGEALVSEAGWSDYYKDPYYLTFFTQAIGHNTVLVGGNPESQTIADTPQFKALANYPRITDSLTSDFYDGVSSELSTVYQNLLGRYVRRIVFVKPNYFVVFDDLQGRGNPQQFDFLLHVPNRDKVKIDGMTAIYNGDKASLAVRSFPLTVSKLSVENGRIPYHVFAARTPAETPALPAYLDFKTIKPVTETQFVTAIVPAKTEQAARHVIEKMTELSGVNLKGIRVERDSKTDLVMFRVGDGAQTIRTGEWVLDGSTLTTTQNVNALEMFAVQNARSLRRGNQVLFSSESPVSVGAAFGSNEVKFAGNAKVATKTTLYVGKTPVRVLLDGKELAVSSFSFNRNDGTISLVIPAGQHELKILFQ